MQTTDVPTMNCGAIRAADEGRRVTLHGWINRRRDHGGLIFLDIRDHNGISQVVCAPSDTSFAEAEHLRHEDVVRIVGTVRMRPEGTTNAKLATGDVEIAVEELSVLNRSAVPPFAVNNDDAVDENLRLEYRYLDLRRPRMQFNLRTRHKILKVIRDYFDEREFIEIETPMLIKSTPAGARDYLVPSRLHPGTCYALPQSPQLLKQISMIGGFGRYMQIARCMRDEDLRADRQPEFTQVDVEMSFATQEDVMETMESCMRTVWKRVLDCELPPFKRMTYAEALQQYGSDKPDLRFGLELHDVTALFAQSDFVVFRSAIDAGGNVVALKYPGGAALSRRDFDSLTESAKRHGAKGLVWVALGPDGLKSSAAKFISPDLADSLAKSCEAVTGDAMLLFADTTAVARAVAGKMRVEIASRCNLRDAGSFAFCWVTGFPYLERDEVTGRAVPAHHPFSSPMPGDWELIEKDPFAMRAQHYDMVLNGFELGSGSIRIHDPVQQRQIFAMLGMTDAEIDEQFGFFVRALEFGAPPHGGMALGIDRMVMLACGEENLREVIAFPKNQVGRDVMMDAPSPVSASLLRDLYLTSTAPSVEGGR